MNLKIFPGNLVFLRQETDKTCCTMENEFTSVMQSKTDSELLEIVTKLKGDYQPDAVKAAQQELDSRGLSSEQVKNAESEIEYKELSLEQRSNEPLEVGQKIMFFLFFWGIIPWAMAGTFKNNGYLKKYRDAWKFMKYGAIIFIGIPLLIILILSFLY